MKSEAEVKKDLRKWWNKYPDKICLRPYCQPCSAGVHDYIGSVMGRAVSVEVKKEDYKIKYSPSQAVFAMEFTKTGGLSFLVHSIEECKQLFMEAGINPEPIQKEE